MKLEPTVEALLKKDGATDEDIEKLANVLLFLHVKDKITWHSDIAGRVIIDKVIQRNAAEGIEVYDEMTHSFKGIVATGKLPSESLFIPNEKLYELLKKHRVLWVMKSPRKRGISEQDVSEVFIKLRREQMA